MKDIDPDRIDKAIAKLQAAMKKKKTKRGTPANTGLAPYAPLPAGKEDHVAVFTGTKQND